MDLADMAMEDMDMEDTEARGPLTPRLLPSQDMAMADTDTVTEDMVMDMAMVDTDMADTEARGLLMPMPTDTDMPVVMEDIAEATEDTVEDMVDTDTTDKC